VTAICCGSSRTLLLTNLGEVYSFDYNGHFGFGYNPNNLITVPVRVNGFNNEKIIAIACGSQHCLALSQSGRVFGWGNNNFGQLGFGQNVGSQNSPKLIQLNAISIKQIACGACHSLLLTTDGDVLAFGLNNFGQIGHKNLAKPQIYPIKVSPLGSNKFVDIASECKSNISIAKSIDGFCYVWGESNGRKVYNPERTQFKSVFDAFVSNSKRKVTHKSMPLNVKLLNPKSPQFRIYESISGLFNDSKESDFKFKVNGKYIFVHKLLLKTRCEHFRNMFSNNWSENKTNEIEITDYSYDVYYAFLKYVYTDSVDIKPEEAIELLDLANSYLEEDLKHKCIEIIKNGITINNVCSLYSLAIKYESKELEDYCFEFGSNKFNDICITDDFDNMDKNSMNKLFIRAAANKLFLTNRESYRANHFPNAEFRTYDPYD
jgi:RCC1 and BTB domain-containing protein